MFQPNVAQDKVRPLYNLEFAILYFILISLQDYRGVEPDLLLLLVWDRGMYRILPQDTTQHVLDIQ